MGKWTQWEIDFFSKLIACVCYSINRYFPEVVFYGQYFRKVLSHKKMNFHSAVSPDQIPLHKVSEFYYRFVPRYISRPYMQFEQWSQTLNEINNHQYEVAAFFYMGNFLRYFNEALSCYAVCFVKDEVSAVPKSLIL